jgi:hypothetical protein
MFRNRLCVHKKVFDHGEELHISHNDMPLVAFDVYDHLSPRDLPAFAAQYFL